MVQSRHALDEHVHAFVAELVPAGREHVKGVLKIKIVMSVEMTADKVIDLLLGLQMQILELVDRGEFLDVQPVRQDTVRLALEQMLTLERRDVRHGRENVGRMRRSSLNAVPVVDASLAGLGIYVEVLEVVVEIDRPRTEIASEQGRMGGEDSGQIHVPLFGQWQGHPGQPLVKMSHHRQSTLVGDELEEDLLARVRVPTAREELTPTYFTQEPRDKITKNNRFVRFRVRGW